MASYLRGGSHSQWLLVGLVAGASLMLLQPLPAQIAPSTDDPVVQQLLERLDELDRELGMREAAIEDLEQRSQAETVAESEPAVEHSDEQQWIVRQNPAHLTIQVLASTDPGAVAGFTQEHDLEGELAVVTVPAGDRVWYKALYGSYPTLASATEAQRALSQKLKSESPWLRKFADVHNEAGLSATAKQSDPAAERVTAVRQPPTPVAPRADQRNRQAQADEAPAAHRPRPAPGSFEVDEDAAERALERTLTEEGALLLPAGRAEVDPSFTFRRREQDRPFFANVDEDLVLTNQEVRRNEVVGRVDVRVGLPWSAQFEFGLPYNFVDETRVADLGSAGRISDSDDGNGLGDLSIGFAKTLWRESGARPDLLARLTYDSDTGDRTDGNVALDGGFNELRGELVALKRQDPLAFVGSVFYQKAFEEDDIEPGDSTGFSLSAVLAASPETSLRFGFSQSFQDDTEVAGQEIDESDRTEGVLSIGASSIVARGVLLNALLGIGLNDDAPDYFIRVSMPIQFSAPFFTAAAAGGTTVSTR